MPVRPPEDLHTKCGRYWNRSTGTVARVRLAEGSLTLEHERRERNSGRQSRSQRERQVRHLVVAACATRHPVPNLPRAVGGFPEVGESVGEQRQVHG